MSDLYHKRTCAYFMLKGTNAYSNLCIVSSCNNNYNVISSGVGVIEGSGAFVVNYNTNAFITLLPPVPNYV